MKYFISDTHFFHEALLGNNDFAPRPFRNMEELHQTIIKNWNRVVKEGDVVYHLGDVALHPRYEKGHAEILEVLTTLNGQIIFVKGNHDKRTFFNFLTANDPLLATGGPKFAFHDVGALIKFNHHQYYLTHYPMLLGKTGNLRNLHGHIHHASVPLAENINVGIDAPELAFLKQPLPFGTPVSELQIDEIAAAKQAELAKLAL